MSDVGYVVAGWLVTATAVAAYYVRLVVRTRRATGSGEPR
jgi:hypothetical protein